MLEEYLSRSEGKTLDLKKIFQEYIKRGVITEYLVCINQESRWLSKQEAIKGNLEGKLHAILVHMKNGNHLSKTRTWTTQL